MLDRNFVEGKLDRIENYFQELKKITQLDERKILQEVVNLRALERTFQLIVDEIIDVNLHFIRELELKSPDDFQSSFEVLSQRKILPEDLATRMAPVVGLRNRLVHRYEAVDPEFFVKQVKKECQDFVDYVKFINQYLEKS